MKNPKAETMAQAFRRFIHEAVDEEIRRLLAEDSEILDDLRKRRPRSFRDRILQKGKNK